MKKIVTNLKQCHQTSRMANYVVLADSMGNTDVSHDLWEFLAQFTICTIYFGCVCVCICVQLMAVDVRCCSISVSVIVTVSISLSIALKLLILCALVCSVHSGIQRLLFARISSRYGYPLARVWFYLLKFRTNECRF